MGIDGFAIIGNKCNFHIHPFFCRILVCTNGMIITKIEKECRANTHLRLRRTK